MSSDDVSTSDDVSMPSNELDLLILAPVPPPFGGIAVHVKRLVPRLQAAGLRVGVLNHFGSTDDESVVGALNRNPLNYYRLPKRVPARVLHYHHARWSTLIAVAMAKRRTRARYVATFHSGGLRKQLSSRNPVVRRLTIWALRRFEAIIAVNSSISSMLAEHVGHPVVVVPAFLADEGGDSGYDSRTEAFFNLGRTLVVPAYRIHFSKSDVDVYGLDSATEAFIALAPKNPELNLAFFIAVKPTRGKAKRYLSGLQERIADAGLSDRLLVAFELPLSPAFRHDVVILRPTRSEGDALSVREALSAGVPVVATDVVERPSGTVTFRSDDLPGLCAAVLAAIHPSTPPPHPTGGDPWRVTQASLRAS